MTAKDKAYESGYEIGRQRGFDAGYRRGRIEAAAELHAIYRGRILDAATILSAPMPSQSPSKPVQEKT